MKDRVESALTRLHRSGSERRSPLFSTEGDDDHLPVSTVPDAPGVVLLYSGDRPLLRAHRTSAEGIVIGRELVGETTDDRISRQHARVRFSDGMFAVTDLGSRNGTFVAGRRVDVEAHTRPQAILRTGRTISVLVSDIRRFELAQMQVHRDVVVGPTLAESWACVARAGRTGDTLHLTGETGSGKEVAARAFHEATGVAGELVAVNCATIPAGLAERLLFGTRRGAFSGADRDADGYLATADGGTIFFDEIGELELAVQAKLLRALETREILPLGASRPRKIDVRVVSATSCHLRAEIAARRFREDLYHRVGRPEVRLAPLRERLEDIPWLVHQTVERIAAGLVIDPLLLEACLLRPWPGNVRELVGEIRRAALSARDAGRDKVRVYDLEPSAGLMIEDREDPPPDREVLRQGPAGLPDVETIIGALQQHAGNVTRAARVLGIHRNQLRRFLARHPELAPEPADHAADPTPS